MRNKREKEYKILPVIVEEDHHEVLPHIYRSIGSRHLPLGKLTLVHFDSHPDMLIPLDMPADTVFMKEKLYGCLSIENWIMPAVYAGHISHVVWVKPPWCSQIHNTVTEFVVGKCQQTGCIRTSCKESYFVSEALYVPESKLDNKHTLKLTVLTLTPQHWDQLSKRRSAHVEGADVLNNTESTCMCKVEAGCDKGTCCKNMTNSNTEKLIGCCNSVIASETGCSSFNTAKHSVHVTSEEPQPKRQRVDSANTETCLEQNLESVINALSEHIGDSRYILDIDLDFFSTMNPFREMYGEREYSILGDLYKFTQPHSLEDKDIEKCVIARQKQLDNLKSVFTAFEKDSKAKIVHERADLIHELVTSLQSQWGTKVDYQLVNEAGCTCDDSELPHHVSSIPQIEGLVKCAQDFLACLPKPTIVTVARSSSDDYCPPNQVDMIQELVLNMLGDLYHEINVDLQYEDVE
ncbi:UPF0489 protein C5orf22 homolog [Mya arenaria]|nr:UPF0489 protein C5orf22 homolog [Mya arenaria]